MYTDNKDVGMYVLPISIYIVLIRYTLQTLFLCPSFMLLNQTCA